MRIKTSVSFLFLFFIPFLGTAHAHVMPLGWAIFYMSFFLIGLFFAVLLLAGLPKYLITNAFFKKYISAPKKTRIRVIIVESAIMTAIFLANGLLDEKTLLQIIDTLLAVSENLAVLCFSIFVKHPHLFSFLIILVCVLPVYLVIAIFLNLKLFETKHQETHLNNTSFRKTIYVGFLTLTTPALLTLWIVMSSVFTNADKILHIRAYEDG